jgi:hypothetical protein
MRKSAKDEQKNYMIENYLPNLTRHILENVRSASCHCRLIYENLGFIHAAAMLSAMAVFMPISRVMETIDVHFAENQLLVKK